MNGLLIDKEVEAQTSEVLPQFTQLARGKAGLQLNSRAPA